MKKRLLIVEDSATQREKLRMILESEDFEVVVAQDGLEGLRVAGESNFDMVISDILMPGLTGYELCRKLKTQVAKKGTPVILLTTLSDPMDVIQGLECGADNFITKPYEPEILIERVKNVLENWRLRAEGKLETGIDIFFLGKKFSITSERQQILNLLITTFEDMVRTNKMLVESQQELMEANEQVERYSKLLEGKVHLSEEKYRLLLEHAHDAIVVLGPGGKVLEANWQAGRMFGLVRSEVEGADFFNLLPVGQRDKAREGFRRLVTEKKVFVQEYNLADTSQGHYVECSISLVDQGGNLAVAIFHNMTERKNAEQDLRKHADGLERHNEELKRLAQLVSRDLGEPIREMESLAKLLAVGSKGQGNETLLGQLSRVTGSLESVRSVTRDFADNSRALDRASTPVLKE